MIAVVPRVNLIAVADVVSTAPSNVTLTVFAEAALASVIFVAFTTSGSTGFSSRAAFTTQRYFFAVLFAVLMFLKVTVTTVVPVRNPLP